MYKCIMDTEKPEGGHVPNCPSTMNVFEHILCYTMSIGVRRPVIQEVPAIL